MDPTASDDFRRADVDRHDSPPWLFLCPSCQQSWQWHRMASCRGHCICRAPMTQDVCWCPQSFGHTVVMVQAESGLESASQQLLLSGAFHGILIMLCHNIYKALYHGQTHRCCAHVMPATLQICRPQAQLIRTPLTPGILPTGVSKG